MVIDASLRRLFAVCSGNAMLVVFDLDLHRVVASLKVGGGPDVVGFDPTLHRIYSAGKAGQLTVIQQDSPDAYRVLDQVSTHYGAHTLAVDPISHKVYVGYASLFVHPRIAVFSPSQQTMSLSGRTDGYVLAGKVRQTSRENDEQRDAQ